MEDTHLIEGSKAPLYIIESERDSTEDLSKNVSSLISDNEVPQGRHLGIFSTVILFVSRIVGGGIYSVPSSVFVNCGGNVSLFLFVWLCAAVMAFIGMSMFLELGTILPKSGGRKNFLEFLYDKPPMMTTVILCTYCLMTCFAMSPAMILGKYILYALGYGEDFVNKESYASNYIGIAAIMVIVFVHGLSLNHGLIIQNILGIIKLVIVLLMSLAGMYVTLFYHNASYDITQPSLLFSAAVQSSEAISSASLTSAFIQCFYCFAGWDTVHTVTSEIKDPNRTLKLAGPLSLLMALICYLSLNIAYIKVLTYEEIKNAGPLLGSVLFSKIFGKAVGAQFINISIILSAISNLFVTVYGISRMNQEIFREGLFPFSAQLARNWPCNSPLPSLLICGIVSSFWLYLLPGTGAAFDYLINFEGYGNQIMLLLVAAGLLVRRERLKRYQFPSRTPIVGVVAFLLLSVYLSVGPFFGNGTGNSVGKFPSYQYAAIFLFALSVGFWFMKFVLLPRLFKYTLRSTVVVQNDGLTVVDWRRHPVE
ncbi:Mup3p [Kluyveromyces lactis]|uniref:KLLA0E00507p n=1 Tax=Kluyveromyces lactis (strain ATCC 8585 / CBS 2359 / DSM 70799 / NBRC 1267 / NRRL Y-1140 / WM37) TaxID=284590 RepID=Q6CQ20_KLULA|nr:uncharacterized protein KLLA0_E00507g [Kluyveromyces lactis]CAG99056.1 KLLA0E00507p [Kluyveromyces lactis]|eukprot:XP_453969.1 uncharacterized protein KLLA0_E00507g [Kluyveromyces lactis]